MANYPKHWSYIPYKKDTTPCDNDSFNDINDLFLDDTREINSKYLGVKNKHKMNIPIEIKEGYLYILNARSTDIYKIGISSNFNRRFKDITNSSPLPISIILCCKMNNPEKIENILHEKYSKYYLKNDWFVLSFDILNEIIESINVMYACR